MWGCQALKHRSSETSQVSIRCVVLFSIKNPFRAEPLFSCEDQFFEGGEFRSKVIFYHFFKDHPVFLGVVAGLLYSIPP